MVILHEYRILKICQQTSMEINFFNFMRKLKKGKGKQQQQQKYQWKDERNTHYLILNSLFWNIICPNTIDIIDIKITTF